MSFLKLPGSRVCPTKGNYEQHSVTEGKGMETERSGKKLEPIACVFFFSYFNWLIYFSNESQPKEQQK